MRAISLVLLSIAIMALLLTDADAKRRSSAQGSQVAGASGSWCATHPRHGSEQSGSGIPPGLRRGDPLPRFARLGSRRRAEYV